MFLHLFLIFIIIILIAIIIFIILYKKDKFTYIEKNKNTSIRKALSFLENNQLYCPATPIKNKFIAWYWEGAGFANTKMSMDIIFSLSLIYDRTLILPPKGYWHHMPSSNCCQIEDFYDFDAWLLLFFT